MALQTILNAKQKKLLEAERELFTRLISVLARAQVPAEDTERLYQSIIQLEELFLLVVVGEFNSGKSAFINALLGQRVLTVGVTPTTHQIHLVRHGVRSNKKSKGPRW